MYPSMFALMVLASSSSNVPFTPVPGGVVAWLVCSRRKHEEIGGWLMFYYWQVYAGVLISALFLAIGLRHYVPGAWGANPMLYRFYLASTVPPLLLLLTQATIASFLLSVRSWQMVKVLRFVIALQVVVGAAAIWIEWRFFPGSMIFDVIAQMQFTAWFAYFIFSKRVRRVFETHDWAAAAI